MEALNNIVARVRGFWSDSSPLVRATLVVGIILVLVGATYAWTGGAGGELIALSEQPMSLEQVGRITGELEKRNLEFKVVESGTQVLVPRARRGDLLASLAASGVSVRPEVPEALETSLLATDFQQREQVRRSLERSLARDISSMTAIERAEVHISPGSDSVFSRNKRKGAASVVVKIRPGFSFSKERAMSLKHLVAQAAHRYGVTSGSVTVVDHEARTLAPSEDDSELGLNTKALALQRETEDDLADRIRVLLEPVVGPGRVRVQVRTKMNLNRVVETAEQYDPDNATVLTERKTSENSRAQRQRPPTVAGAPGNIPQGVPATAGGGGSRSNQARDITDTSFAVPKVVRHTKHAIGDIQRMSVAVLVDAAAFATPPSEVEPDGDPPAVKVPDPEVPQVEISDLPPRPNDEMLLALVRDAVAFDPSRGDTVTLSFQPFVRASTLAVIEPPGEPPTEIPSWLPTTLVVLVGFALVAGALYSAERRRRREAEAEAERAAANGPQSDEEPEESEPSLRDRVRLITQENVPATAEVIKSWLSTTPQKG